MKKLSIIFAFSLVFFAKIAHSQTGNEVDVTIMVPPPYSPYLSDYEGLLQHAIITLTNRTNTNLSLKLTGSMVGDNGFSARTSPNYLPSQAITLAPFQTRTIVADRAAMAFFNPKNIDFSGDQRMVDNVVRTGILPEGSYEICVQARGYTSNIPLSADAPFGCTTVVIQWVSPPLLSSPACGETLTLIQNTATIGWLPVVTFPGRSNVVYDLYLVRVLLGQDPNDAIAAAINFRAGNPVVKEGLVASTYILTPADPPLAAGATYAYAVVARDPLGRIVFENGGRSEVCIFHTQPATENTWTMAPQTTDWGAAGLEGLGLATPFVHLEGKLFYKFYGDSGSDGNSGFQLSQLNSMHNLNVGQSLSNYGYQIQSGNNNLGFQNVGQGFMMGTAYGNFQSNLPPMPTYLFNSVGTDGARPLKHMRVTFTAVYLTGNVPNPRSEADFRVVGLNCFEEFANGGGLTERVEITRKVLGTATTNALGKFSFSGFTDGNTGVLATGHVVFSYGGGGDVCNGPADGWGLYRVITMQIENPYYCDPDIVIFAQPFQSMQLPDITVHVRSYNLEVSVVADNKDHQQASAGGPIRNAKVRIGRSAYFGWPEGFPKNESRIESFGQTEKIKGTSMDFVVEEAGNANQNGKFTFTRLVQHPGIGLDNTPPCPAPHNLYLGDFESDDNIGNLNYAATWSELGTCQAALSISKPPNATFVPPTFYKTITLHPKYPEIYLQTKADYGNTSGNGYGNLQPLPSVLTNLWVIPTSGSAVQFQCYSDANGLLRLNPFNNSFKHVNGAGVPDKDCQLDFWKSGFRCKNCPSGHKTLQWGERWTPTVIMEPKALVKGEVLDEFGDPVMAQVRVAEGPFVLTKVVTQPANNNNNFFASNWPENLVAMGVNMEAESSSTGWGNVNANPGFELQAGTAPSIEMLPWKAVFETRAPSGNQIKVIVQPLQSQYFPDTFLVNIPETSGGEAFDLGKFVVKQRLHRPRFQVVTMKRVMGSDGIEIVQQVAVPGAKVKVANENPKFTNDYGYAAFAFASPEEEEFSVSIDKEGYIPYDQYAIIPVSKNPLLVRIFLEKAEEVSGKVSDAATGLAIAGARVYAHVGTNEFGNITVETLTNTLGEYTLRGLPGGEQHIFAAKSGGDKTYLGEEKTVTLPRNIPLNFQLQTAPFDMPKIWGIYVEIESSTAVGNGRYKINGAFVKLPANERFKPEDNQQRLPFEDLEIKLSGGNGPGGQPRAEPVASKVVTNTLKMRALVNNDLLVELSGPVPTSASPDGGYYYQIAPYLQPILLHKITVVKQSNGNGAVMAKAYTQLEYMNFAHQYNGQFYLGETASSPNVRVFQAGTGWTPQQRYNLFDYDFVNNQAVNPAYRVHNFPAFADRNDSYLRRDSFVLATTLVVDLPQSNPDKINVRGGKIVITPNNVYVLNGSQKIQFELETWKVELNNWTFSNTYGGIRGPGKITTNAMTIPAGAIIIRPNELLLPGSNDIDLSGLKLAGVVSLNVQNPVNFHLDYQGPGSVQHDPGNGHWRLQISKFSGHVATVQNLPGLAESIKIGHIENYSDGFYNMTLPPNQILNHYNVLPQKLENLYVHSDGFTLNGAISPGIPNLPSNTTADFTYYKEGGIVKMRLSGLNADFETTGQISFDGDAQIGRIKLQQNLLEIPGWATIYDDASAGTIRLRTKIVKTPQQVKMLVMKVGNDGESEGNSFQAIAMGGGSSKMLVLEGEQLATGNQWKPLQFQAALDGFGGGFQSGKNKIWLVVDGAVTTDKTKNNDIQLTNINTPFGGLSLTFDFEDQALVGNMHVQNIPLGAMNILEGTLETRMSGKGFYLLCQMDAVYPLIGQLRTNFIAGSYPSISPEARELLIQGMHIKKLPAHLSNSGIQGLFVCANKPVLEIDFEVDLVVIGVGLYADAGVDARFWVNFGDAYGGAHLGAMMYADIEAYVQVLVCEFCFGLNAEIAADAEYQWTPSDNFSLTACGSVGVSGDFCGIAEISETVRLDLGWQSSGGFDLDVTLGTSCSGMSSSSGGCVHF